MYNNKTDTQNPGCPYQDLYIYYLEGHLKKDTQFADPGFIGNWEEDEFCFLFYHQPSDKKVENLLLSQPQLTLLDQYLMAYNDWQGGAPEPFEVGDFFIFPPWMNLKELQNRNPDKIHIILDPGVVFGTGTHPTTQDCLKALIKVFALGSPKSVLDLGTGTGLLALAASKLGCGKVLAVDMNDLAVRTARHNIHLNRMEKSVLAVQGKAEDFMEYDSDLIVTNIHFEIMKFLIQHQGFLNKKWFILSGLMRSQAREATEIIKRLPVEILNEWSQDGIWHTFFGKLE